MKKSYTLKFSAMVLAMSLFTLVTNTSLPQKEYSPVENLVTKNHLVTDDGDEIPGKVFYGIEPYITFGNTVCNTGDVNGDGFDDILILSTGVGVRKAHIYFGGLNMNTIPDVELSSEQSGDDYGFSLSTAGDVNGDGYSDVIIGANRFNSNTGRVYIYFGGISMDSVADVIMNGDAPGYFFGVGVSTAGDVNDDGFSDVIVGATGYNSFTGRSYIYYGGASMDTVKDVILTGETVSDRFGVSVSEAGDVNGDGYSDVIVGARAYSSSTGRSYIFYGGISMNNIADVTMTGEMINDFFGRFVSTAGDVNGDGYSDVIVGAWGYNSFTGRAYVFLGSTLMDNIPDVTMTGEMTNNSFGLSVSEAGDVNNDGYTDVIIGAEGYSNNVGRAYLYFGGTSMDNVVDKIISGDAGSDFLGTSVSTAGDVNGDGFSDVIIGAVGNTLVNSYKGKAVLFDNFRRNDIITNLTFSGTGYFGESVSDAGDVNGDGYSDLIIGANEFNSFEGRAYIYYGGTSMDNIADVTLQGGNFRFGLSVSSAGDVNNDGYSDVVVGEYTHYADSVRSYVYFGSPNMDSLVDVVLVFTGANNLTSTQVEEAGDVNGDGYSDVIVGADDYSLSQGKAFIFFGGSFMNGIPDVTLSVSGSSIRFGASVSSVGDMNKDGYSDVIVGDSEGSLDSGKSYIFFGGSPMNSSADVVLTGENLDSQLGTDVSSAGDVNGDGFSDAIVCSPGYRDSSGYYVGAAYIYLGGSSVDNIADIVMYGERITYDLFVFVSNAGDLNNDGYSDIITSNNSNEVHIFLGNTLMDNKVDLKLINEYQFGFSISSAGDVNNDNFSDILVGSLTNKAYLYLGSAVGEKTLNTAVFIEGFYNSANNLQVSDTINVSLRNIYPPYDIEFEVKKLLPQNGVLTIDLDSVASGNYYIVFSHRNSVETWSKTGGEYFDIGGTVNYDMSISQSQAFGNNIIQVDASPLRFALYSGDVNQDGTVDATDVSLIDNDAANFNGGYIVTDLTGDNFVDGTDFAIADNNAANFVSVVRP